MQLPHAATSTANPARQLPSITPSVSTIQPLEARLEANSKPTDSWSLFSNDDYDWNDELTAEENQQREDSLALYGQIEVGLERSIRPIVEEVKQSH